MKKSLVAPLLLALLAVPAAAQDTTAQAAAQEKRIQELEKKVDDLTTKKAKAEQAKPAPEAKVEGKEAGKNPEIDGLSVNLTGRAFLDGTWFSGRLTRVEDTHVSLTSPDIKEPLRLPLDGVRLSGLATGPQVDPSAARLGAGLVREVKLVFASVPDAVADGAVLILRPGLELQAYSEVLR